LYLLAGLAILTAAATATARHRRLPACGIAPDDQPATPAHPGPQTAERAPLALAPVRGQPSGPQIPGPMSSGSSMTKLYDHLSQNSNGVLNKPSCESQNHADQWDQIT
jgi:hypothetical protein